jgi:hypothetical protein
MIAKRSASYRGVYLYPFSPSREPISPAKLPFRLCVSLRLGFTLCEAAPGAALDKLPITEYPKPWAFAPLRPLRNPKN